jgi:hypothetical protein
MPLLQLLRKA